MLTSIVKYLPQMFKALTAMALTASSEYGLAQRDGLTWGEWGYIIGTVAAVGYATWKVSNARTQVSSSTSAGTS